MRYIFILDDPRYGTDMNACGMSDNDMMPGPRRSTMYELAARTAAAEQVPVF